MNAGELSPKAPFGVVPYVTSPVSVPPAVAGASLRSNFVWALAGNTIYAACQWAMIVALAKLGSSTMVGQFSLGLAISTPLLMFTNVDLRAVQATDARRQYRFAEYLRLRMLTTLVGLAAIGGVVWFGHYEARTAMVVLAVALAKAVETLSDIHYGQFQLNDRLDQTGRSMMLRGVASVAALTAGLYLTRSVFWGCMWVAAAWLCVLLLFDVRRGRRLAALTESPVRSERAAPSPWGLLRLALPLGIVTTVASINLHMPRYFIHARMGEQELGMFSALAYATVSLTLVGDSLGNSAIPRLSRLYALGRLGEFRGLLLRLLGIGSAIGLAGLAIAHGAGARLVTLIYSPEYAVHTRVFTLLMAAAAVQFAASMLTSGITSARRFRIQVPLYLMVAGATAWGCARWIPVYGLAGGAIGVLCGAVVRLLLAAAIVGFLLLRPGNAKPIEGWSQ